MCRQTFGSVAERSSLPVGQKSLSSTLNSTVRLIRSFDMISILASSSRSCLDLSSHLRREYAHAPLCLYTFLVRSVRYPISSTVLRSSHSLCLNSLRWRRCTSLLRGNHHSLRPHRLERCHCSGLLRAESG